MRDRQELDRRWGSRKYRSQRWSRTGCTWMSCRGTRDGEWTSRTSKPCERSVRPVGAHPSESHLMMWNAEEAECCLVRPMSLTNEGERHRKTRVEACGFA